MTPPNPFENDPLSTARGSSRRRFIEESSAIGVGSVIGLSLTPTSAEEDDSDEIVWAYLKIDVSISGSVFDIELEAQEWANAKKIEIHNKGAEAAYLASPANPEELKKLMEDPHDVEEYEFLGDGVTTEQHPETGKWQATLNLGIRLQIKDESH